jgi:hypothetical protein
MRMRRSRALLRVRAIRLLLLVVQFKNTKGNDYVSNMLIVMFSFIGKFAELGDEFRKSLEKHKDLTSESSQYPSVNFVILYLQERSSFSSEVLWSKQPNEPCAGCRKIL